MVRKRTEKSSINMCKCFTKTDNRKFKKKSAVPQLRYFDEVKDNDLI